MVLGTASVAVEVDTPVSGEACELELETLTGIMSIDPTGYRYFDVEVRDCYGDPVEARPSR